MHSAPIQGSPYNTISLRMYEVIEVTIRWDWDGVSTEAPDGAVVDIFVSNIDTADWIATFPGKTKGGQTFVITAGSSQTYSGGALNNLGLSSLPAASGLTLVRA